jgi:hypothetical protein
MPAKSRRQQRYLFAKFGEEWVKQHHFDKLAGRMPNSQVDERVKHLVRRR